jgi:hypothetical protein
MKITATQAEPEALTGLAQEAAGLLATGRYDQLVQSFGYALAFGRDLAEAIRTDLAACLAELGANGLSKTPPSIRVSRFSPNSTALVALAECTLPAEPSGCILLELVVTAGEAQHHVTLEQVTAVA